MWLILLLVFVGLRNIEELRNTGKCWGEHQGYPPSRMVPGYLTSKPSIISAYLDVCLTNQKLHSEQVVYIIETEIDLSRLKVKEGEASGFDQDRTILPGYVGTEFDDALSMDEITDVVVWNEPINIKVVGAYRACDNLEPSHYKNKEYAQLKADSDAKRDMKTKIGP